jgi:protein tyrosine/serine phosphatase
MNMSLPQLELNEAFEAIHNFRDFGGYAVPEGRVKLGQLYRSAHYGTATDADLETFARLGMAAIVDLRRPGERFRLPSRRAENCRAVMIAYGQPSDDVQPPHLSFLNDSQISEELIEERMTGIYRDFAFEPGHIEVFGAAFAKLAEADGPIVLHCHAGKDRTGLICALIHHVLGVSDEDMFADYLRTNEASRIEQRLAEVGAAYSQANGVDFNERFVRKVLRVERKYLEAAFDSIVKAHGSLDDYIEKLLCVDDAMRERIRSRLIEPA